MQSKARVILTSKETYFVILFLINAVAVAFGYNQFQPDQNIAAIAPVLISIVGVVASSLSHPVIKSQSVDEPNGIADAGKPK